MLNKIISSHRGLSEFINFMGGQFQKPRSPHPFTVKNCEYLRIAPSYNKKSQTATDGLVLRIVSGTFIPTDGSMNFNGFPITFMLEKLVLEASYSRHPKSKEQKDYIQRIQLTYSCAVINSDGDFSSYTPVDKKTLISRTEFNNHKKKHSSELFQQRYDSHTNTTAGFNYVSQQFDAAGICIRRLTAEFANENPNNICAVAQQFTLPFILKGKGTLHLKKSDNSLISVGIWREGYTEKKGHTLDLDSQTLRADSDTILMHKTGGYQYSQDMGIVYGDIHTDFFDASGALATSVSGCILEKPPLFLRNYSDLASTRVQRDGNIQYHFPTGTLQLRTNYLFKMTSPSETMHGYSHTLDPQKSGSRLGLIKARIVDNAGQCMLQFSIKIEYTVMDSHLILQTAPIPPKLSDFLKKFKLESLSSFPKNYESLNPREKRNFLLKKIEVIETEIKITTKDFLCESENTSVFDAAGLLELLIDARMQLSIQLKDDFLTSSHTTAVHGLPSKETLAKHAQKSKAALKARLEIKEQKKAEKKRRHEEWLVRHHAIEKEDATDFSAELKNVTEMRDLLSQNFDSSGLQLPLRLVPKTTPNIDSLIDTSSGLRHYIKEFKDVLSRFQVLMKKDKKKEHPELKECVTSIKLQIQTIQDALSRYNTYYKQCSAEWQITCMRLNFLESPEDRGLKQAEIETLRSQIHNPDLADIFNQNYRKGAGINDGSTAGIIIEESIQKKPIHCPTGHLLKGLYLLDLLHSIDVEMLNAFDRSLYFQIISDLQYAITFSAQGEVC